MTSWLRATHAQRVRDYEIGYADGHLDDIEGFDLDPFIKDENIDYIDGYLDGFEGRQKLPPVI